MLGLLTPLAAILVTYLVDNLLVVVLIVRPRRVPWLGTSRPLGHDDLIHSQDGAGGVRCVLQGPIFSNHQVQDTSL